MSDHKNRTKQSKHDQTTKALAGNPAATDRQNAPSSAGLEEPWSASKSPAQRDTAIFRFKKSRNASKVLPRQKAVRSLDFPWSRPDD